MTGIFGMRNVAGIRPPDRGQGIHLGRLPRPDPGCHRALSAPLVWAWDNLNIHRAPELAGFAQENEAWLRICRLPAYTPDLNPAEGIWPLLKRSMVNFAAADLDGLVRIIRHKLKKIQYRPHLINGCLAAPPA